MTLSELNTLPQEQLKEELQKCCGSSRWVQKMCSRFPFKDEPSLFKRAEDIWFSLKDKDWKQAFEHHPKIGDITLLKERYSNIAQLAAGEQAGVQQAPEKVLQELARCNKHYEDNFGYIFIVCATGKSAEEMLAFLKSRMNNHPKEEIKIAASEQNKITKIRLEKLLS